MYDLMDHYDHYQNLCPIAVTPSKPALLQGMKLDYIAYP